MDIKKIEFGRNSMTNQILKEVAGSIAASMLHYDLPLPEIERGIRGYVGEKFEEYKRMEKIGKKRRIPAVLAMAPSAALAIVMSRLVSERNIPAEFSQTRERTTHLLDNQGWQLKHFEHVRAQVKPEQRPEVLEALQNNGVRGEDVERQVKRGRTIMELAGLQDHAPSKPPARPVAQTKKAKKGPSASEETRVNAIRIMEGPLKKALDRFFGKAESHNIDPSQVKAYLDQGHLEDHVPYVHTVRLVGLRNGLEIPEDSQMKTLVAAGRKAGLEEPDHFWLVHHIGERTGHKPSDVLSALIQHAKGKSLRPGEKVVVDALEEMKGHEYRPATVRTLRAVLRA